MDDAQRVGSAGEDGASGAAGVGAGEGRRDPGTSRSLKVAWIASIALVVVVTASQWFGTAGAERRPAAALDAPKGGGGITLLLGRYAVGADAALSDMAPESGEQALAAIEPSAPKTPAGLLRLAILAGEIEGSEAGLERLSKAVEETEAFVERLRAARADGAAREDAPDDGDADDAGAQDEAEIESDAEEIVVPAWFVADAEALQAIYGAGSAEAAALPDEAVDGLTARHGWFGRLALAHGVGEGDPRREDVIGGATFTLIVVASGVSAAGLGFVVGLVLLLLGLLGVKALRMRGGYAPPSAGGSVFLEVLPLFLAGFLVIGVMQVLLAFLGAPDVSWLLVWGLLPIATWPVLRGVSWGKWRYAVGWHAGRGVGREIGAGIVGYLMGLPIFAVGVLTMFLLMSLWTLVFGEGDGGTPSHPAVEQAMNAGVLEALRLYLLAAVWAPVVEETVFRGALYHHLRGWLAPIGSALVTGFVFAVIHPQGVLAIPALMSLGVAFAFIREWRGSAIPCMVAHALHNGALMTILLLATS